MPTAILYDTVTLRHFAACSGLDLLADLSAVYASPYWVEQVRTEVRQIATTQVGPPRTHCRYILSQTWLGEPHEAVTEDQLAIFAIRTALDAGFGGNPRLHLGEAQTIYFAEKLGAIFATDDGPAFTYAEQRLGPDNVVDTVDLLRIAVNSGRLTAEEAARLVADIRAAGRFLRRVHRTPLKATDMCI